MSFDYKNLKNKKNKFYLDELKKEIEKWDEDFYKFHYDKKTYKVGLYRTRLMITEDGKLIYKRRVYQHRKTKEYICFTDLEFGLEKWNKVTNDLKKLVFKDIDKGLSIRAIKRSLNKNSLGRSTISSILSSNIDNSKIIVENTYKKKLPY